MSDFTITLDETTAALTSAAFAEKFGVEATPAAVLAQLGAYIAEIVADYVQHHALMDAQQAADTQEADVRSALATAFTAAAAPAPMPVTTKTTTA